jgi:hypothetical protein
VLDEMSLRGETIEPVTKTALGGLVLVLVVAVGLAVRTTTCSSWQDEYKRFMYSETLKNSPIIYTPEDIDRIIGTKPSGCTRPTSLTDEDITLFREENVGPNHFIDEIREARQRNSS